MHSLRLLVRQRTFFTLLGVATKCRIHGVCTALGAAQTTERPLHKAGRMAITNGPNEELREMYALLDEIAARKERIERKIAGVVTSIPLHRIVSSIPGVGPVTGAAIIAERCRAKQTKKDAQTGACRPRA